MFSTHEQVYAPLPSFALPKASGRTHWVWTSDWMVDMSMRGYGAPAVGATHVRAHVSGAVDAEGWAYARGSDSPYGYDYAVDGTRVQEQRKNCEVMSAMHTLLSPLCSPPHFTPLQPPSPHPSAAFPAATAQVDAQTRAQTRFG